MSFPRPSNRRVRPKGSAPRPGDQPPLDPAAGSAAGGPRPGATPSDAGATPGPATGAGAGGGPSGTAPIRPGSRAANRAAKRASSGVRPKKVVRGRVSGRKNRGYSPALIGLAIGAVLIGAAVIALGNPFGSPSASASPSAASSAGAVRSHGDGTCPASQPASLAAGQSRLVTIETELGDIVIKVDGALSPIAAGNFVALASCKFYDGIVFHRTPTLPDGTPFVIQGGDPEGTGGGGPGYTIADEPVTATYKRGTVAMARTNQPNSQGSQFFIVLDDKSKDPLAAANTYAILGEVISGMEVADAIFDASEGEELPTDPIAMTSVTVANAPAATASPVPASAAPTSASTAAPTTAP